MELSAGAGLPSLSNADLARGCDRVLILSPQPQPQPQPQGGATPWGSLADRIAELRPVEVLVVHVDEALVTAFGRPDA